jgi:hypothetical protein
MPFISWQVNLDGKDYKIDLDHGLWSGKRIVQVNGETVHKATKFFDSGTSKHPFKFGTHSGLITIGVGVNAIYDLYIDKEPQQRQRFTFMQIMQTMPIWGWVLTIALAFITAIAQQGVASYTGQRISLLGGIVWLIYGVIHIVIWMISSHQKTSVWIRATLCILISVGYSAAILFSVCSCSRLLIVR